MKKIQDKALEIRYRSKPKDKYYTPENLAADLIKKVPLIKGDFVLDPCKGHGAFYNNYPEFVKKDWFEIDFDKDFMNEYIPLPKYDWIITNPPYSDLSNWLKKITYCSKKGFALLLSEHAITPKRLEEINNLGFGITLFHYVKVMQWYGLSVFIVFEKNKKSILSYDRKIYHSI